jgi:hypothetical protein
MEDTDEIKLLLREIRDLLKADFEAGTEFRKAALARQQGTDERNKVSRDHERHVRDELAQEVKETQAAVRKALGGPWGFVARMAVAIGLAVCGALVLLRGLRLLDR